MQYPVRQMASADVDRESTDRAAPARDCRTSQVGAATSRDGRAAHAGRSGCGRDKCRVLRRPARQSAAERRRQRGDGMGRRSQRHVTASVGQWDEDRLAGRPRTVVGGDTNRLVVDPDPASALLGSHHELPLAAGGRFGRRVQPDHGRVGAPTRAFGQIGVVGADLRSGHRRCQTPADNAIGNKADETAGWRCIARNRLDCLTEPG